MRRPKFTTCSSTTHCWRRGHDERVAGANLAAMCRVPLSVSAASWSEAWTRGTTFSSTLLDPRDGGRIGTAAIGGRENRRLRRGRGRRPGLSGAGTPRPSPQNPAESREFLGLNLVPRRKSLQQQTEWRWGESGANSSLGRDPWSAGKIQGNPPQSASPGGIRSKIPQP